MTTTSVTSTIVSTLGGGSGIDMTALATGLATAQFAARIDRNTTQKDTVERQISAAADLKNQILTLASSVGDRVRAGDVSTQPIIANGAVATVSRGAASGSGTYSLEVIGLAASQTLSSPAYQPGNLSTGSGTLTLRFGTISGGQLVPDTAHPAVDIAIPSGSQLADVAAAINAANAGVSAYIATGTDGVHLMLKGQDGAPNAFSLEATEAAGDPGLANLAWDPTGDPLRLKSAAASAIYKLDGLEMTSASNTISDIVPGLSLKLTGTNENAPTKISFSDPSSAATTFMQDLTSALNELVSSLSKAIDPKTGDLARDSGARALRRSLTQLAGSIVMPSAATGAPSTLADLGLATNRDGTFRLDTTRLAATLKSSPSGVAAMFTTGLYGVYATLDKLSRSVTAASDPGSLTGSVTRYTALQAKLGSEATKLADDQEKLRAQLVTRFAGVDSRVGASKSTLSFLQNQIAAWNATKN